VRGIPAREIAILVQAAREGQAEDVVFHNLGTAEHALLRDAHVNGEGRAYSQSGAREEDLPKPDFPYESHGSHAQRRTSLAAGQRHAI
jgi:hypothetical protein